MSNSEHAEGGTPMVEDAFWEHRVSAVWFGPDGVVDNVDLAEWGEIEIVHADGEIQRLYVDIGAVPSTSWPRSAD